MSAAGRPLYLLSFDHRGSFKNGLMGIAGEPPSNRRRCWCFISARRLRA